jgi:hypothetical protein
MLLHSGREAFWLALAVKPGAVNNEYNFVIFCLLYVVVIGKANEILTEESCWGAHVCHPQRLRRVVSSSSSV